MLDATPLDATHDIARQSWVPSAQGHADFPIHNLPFGLFAPGEAAVRGGFAIGDMILDLAAVRDARLLSGKAQDAAAICNGTANGFFTLEADARNALRTALSDLLSSAASSSARAQIESALHPAARCTMQLPAQIGDYSDFYAGIHHAEAVGTLFRPDAPLPENYTSVPMGYHGRASSIRPSGEGVRRPNGQRGTSNGLPTFGPTRSLDHELELGIWIGPGNAQGERVPLAQAARHIAGFCLLNDWSARDIQRFEYQPLGPFLGKSFHTTISPWVVTPEALAPFRRAQTSRRAGDPVLLAYLADDNDRRAGAYDITLEAFIVTERMRRDGLPPHRLSRANASDLYWTVAQLLTHQTSNGCNLRPGDLLGSGTISSGDVNGHGSLLEMSHGGKESVPLPSGETRIFLEDGDEVILRGRARRDGYASIGFGECRAVVLAAKP